MNLWDLFTWLMAAVLGVGSLVVFVFFVRDARRIWSQLGRPN